MISSKYLLLCQSKFLDTTQTMHTHPLFGAFLGTLAMLLFTITYTFYKMSNVYIPPTLSIFFQSLISWLIILPFACKNGLRNLYSPKWLYIVLRTIAGLITLFCISTAVMSTDLANVVVLNSASPLFVPFIAWIWNEEKIAHKLWVPLIIGFIGIITIFRPGMSELKLGLFLALISGLSTSFLVVATRKISKEPLEKILFFYFLIICIGLAPFLFTHWDPTSLFSAWPYLVLSGITMVVAQICFTFAMRYGSSQEIAPLIYTGVVFSGLIDWIFWNTTPNGISLIGWGIVCAGGILTLHFSQKKKVI